MKLYQSTILMIPTRWRGVKCRVHEMIFFVWWWMSWWRRSGRGRNCCTEKNYVETYVEKSKKVVLLYFFRLWAQKKWKSTLLFSQIKGVLARESSLAPSASVSGRDRTASVHSHGKRDTTLLPSVPLSLSLSRALKTRQIGRARATCIGRDVSLLPIIPKLLRTDDLWHWYSI